MPERLPRCRSGQVDEAPWFAQAHGWAKPDQIHYFVKGGFGNRRAAEMPNIQPPYQKIWKATAVTPGAIWFPAATRRPSEDH